MVTIEKRSQCHSPRTPSAAREAVLAKNLYACHFPFTPYYVQVVPLRASPHKPSLGGAELLAYPTFVQLWNQTGAILGVFHSQDRN
jgi:hypothetical protein